MLKYYFIEQSVTEICMIINYCENSLFFVIYKFKFYQGDTFEK